MDDQQPLHEYLSDVLNTKILAREVGDALGLSSFSAYASRVHHGFRAGEVIAAAKHFGADPTRALYDLGYIERPTDTKTVSQASTQELAEELAKRLSKAPPKKKTTRTRKAAE